MNSKDYHHDRPIKRGGGEDEEEEEEEEEEEAKTSQVSSFLLPSQPGTYKTYWLSSDISDLHFGDTKFES